jgi:hypothetical protein
MLTSTQRTCGLWLCLGLSTMFMAYGKPNGSPGPTYTRQGTAQLSIH